MKEIDSDTLDYLLLEPEGRQKRISCFRFSATTVIPAKAGIQKPRRSRRRNRPGKVSRWDTVIECYSAEAEIQSIRRQLKVSARSALYCFRLRIQPVDATAW
ncbi:MAG: hypothetical protein R3E40_03970 [Rhodocyclaceae bacterium]